MSTPSKKKVLIIDDNPGILFASRQALEFEGYEVFSSTRFPGERSVITSSPDIIFLDVFLADQDGRAIARELKTRAKTKHIPIVLLSAYPGIDKFAIAAGADDYLSKPFDLEEFLAIAKKYTTDA